MKFSPRVRLVGNVGAAAFWVAAAYLMATEGPVIEASWFGWVAGIGVVIGFLGALRGVYLAYQEHASAR